MSTNTTEKWFFWNDTAHTPAENMAYDEALLQTATQREYPVLRFYAWDCKAVSIGYVQAYDSTPEGFAVVRRPTGGGIVYHDYDFTYTVVIPANHWIAKLDRTESYNKINSSVLVALDSCSMSAAISSDDKISHTVDRSSMICFTNPTKYDILLNNNKISGSAQRRTKTGILHQGSIHFGEPLPMPKLMLAKALYDGFIKNLNLKLITWTPEKETIQLGQKLVEERYSTDAWNRRR